MDVVYIISHVAVSMKTAEEMAKTLLASDTVQHWLEGETTDEQFNVAVADLLRAYGEQVREECANFAHDSVEFSITMRAGEYARVAATIEDQIRALKLP
jgi:hypothetical protein